MSSGVKSENNAIKVSVCMGSGGLAAGSPAVYDQFAKELTSRAVKAALGERKCDHVHKTGCKGPCAMDVLVDVIVPGMDKQTYAQVTPDMVPEIVQEHIINKKPVKKWLVSDAYEKFFSKQERNVLARCGKIDPENIEEYLANDGYKGLEKALKMAQEELIEEVKSAGLRGRSGGGFPTGLKWGFCQMSSGSEKYFMANSHEGDAAAYMDRSILEGDPHAVLEGLIIGAYAIGANYGYFYAGTEEEAPFVSKRLHKALEQARKAGYLGKNILGSGFDFEVEIVEGAGAYVCGEETAQMCAIEGYRGMPRLRPPFPAHKGLWAKPTNVNNVETLANVPLIVRKGSEWYKNKGTAKSNGTKVFSLSGSVRYPGLIEAQMGITLREIVYEMCGGLINPRREFKAAQVGGPASGYIPATWMDTPIDYDSLMPAGIMMGSGGIVVLDQSHCMVDAARLLLEFAVNESCGKCIPCRIGNKLLLGIVERITQGNGKEDDLQLLEDLSADIKQASLCGLGQTSPNGLLSTLRHFREEYIEHIEGKHCRAAVCLPLIKFEVDATVCEMCGSCQSVCPVNAIAWEEKEIASIDKRVCVNCRSCIEICPSGAIT